MSSKTHLSPSEITTGYSLIENPIFNKGSAFTEDERRHLGLLGVLPYHSSTLEEQLSRTYENYRRKDTDLERYIYLSSLHDRNETLFYRLVGEHITEMMPIIYTPTVGLGCQIYSHLFRRPRGLYVSYPHRREIDTILANAPERRVDCIVVTDGERILGLGDLGVGGMGIPVGKLALYTLCAGINPRTTLPIMLDVGTNNRELLEDPLYLGWRHERIKGAEYDAFIEEFVQAVIRRFPRVLLQWEDFSRNNAARLLKKYEDRLCTFNDDIQGTGAVTLAGLLAAVKVQHQTLKDQRICILGAGSSAIGISDQLASSMSADGAPEAQCRKAIWLIDSKGLVTEDRQDIDEGKRRYARTHEEIAGWRLNRPGEITLADVVENTRPTILIGTSAQAGAFTESIVRKMASYVKTPIIFPLSNPTSKSEAVPADIMKWTDGRALVAAGSPFPDYEVNGLKKRFGQCNNSFIFPGMGLGVIASQASRVTNRMFIAAAEVLSTFAPILVDRSAPLYPKLDQVRDISRRVAFEVGWIAQTDGLAPKMTAEELKRRIRANMWVPKYVSYLSNR